MTLDRRKAMGRILGIAGAVAGTAVVGPKAMAAGTCSGDNQIGLGSNGGGELGKSLLGYVKLDPMAVAKRAYEGYGAGGCMYGVFNAIVKELAAQNFDDACKFAAIPTNMTVYGGGGVSGYGTLCGCANAAAMAVNMLDVPNRGEVIHALFRYYEETAMPRGDKAFLNAIGAPTRKTDAGELLTADKIGQSVATSVLCHTSVSLWSKQSQFGAKHQAKLERCAQVTAEIAFTTVQFLNDAVDGKLKADTQAAGNEECLMCHAGTTDEPKDYFATDVTAHMECGTCHTAHD